MNHTDTAELSHTFPEVAVRLIHVPSRQTLTSINTALNAVDYITSVLNRCTVEVLAAVMLDVHLKPLCYSTIGIGTINQVCFSPAEIARTALLTNAAGVILLHNHPSGEPSPSEDDDAAANKIFQALRLFSIALHDFIIIAGDTIYSYKEQYRSPYQIVADTSTTLEAADQ